MFLSHCLLCSRRLKSLLVNHPCCDVEPQQPSSQSHEGHIDLSAQSRWIPFSLLGEALRA